MNKRLIVLLVGLVLIAVIVVINAVVLTVRTVEVDYDTTENAISDDSDLTGRIITASGIKLGKNIFGVSESKMVKNIQASVPSVKVINIERKFPNKVVIHVSKRIPVYIVAYRQSQSSLTDYVLVDSDMVVMEVVQEDLPDYTKVSGFTLMGRYNITVGQMLPVEFGNEVYLLQNIAAGFYNQGLTPAGFMTFIREVDFSGGTIDLHTNGGVTIRLGANLISEDIATRVKKAYAWYRAQPEDSESLKGGTAIYNGDEFIWNTY